jgi:uncharacterized protein (DUF2236 family)
MSTPRRQYWRDRRWNVPSGTAGVMADDTAPTKADDDELRRALAAQGRTFAEIYQGALDGGPLDPGWEWFGPHHRAWIAGRFERNRRRQDAVIDAVCRLGARLFPRRARQLRQLRRLRERAAGALHPFQDVAPAP